MEEVIVANQEILYDCLQRVGHVLAAEGQVEYNMVPAPVSLQSTPSGTSLDIHFPAIFSLWS
jgi:hypothetical protein